MMHTQSSFLDNCKLNKDVVGEVIIQVIENDTITIAKPNLIVAKARHILSHLLGSGDSDYAISRLVLGGGGCNPNDMFVPIPPTVNDIGLYDLVTFSKPAAGITFKPTPENSNSVLFTFIVNKEEGNGTGTAIYNELGLFTTNNHMFSRVTFPSISKTNQIKLIITWEIKFPI